MDSKHIYRSFVVYSVKRNELIFVVRRGCGKSFNNSINEVVKKCKEAQINPQIQNIYHQGNSCEWHGIVDRDSQIYFLVMTLNGMNQNQVLKDAQSLSKMLRKIPQFDLKPRAELQEKKTEDVITMMNEMDKQFSEDDYKFLQSDEDIKEVSIGNTIVLNSDNQFSSQGQNVQQSQIVRTEIKDYYPPPIEFNSNNNNKNNNIRNNNSVDNSRYPRLEFESKVDPNSKRIFQQTLPLAHSGIRRAPINDQAPKPASVVAAELKDLRINYICYSILIITILFGLTLGYVFEII